MPIKLRYLKYSLPKYVCNEKRNVTELLYISQLRNLISHLHIRHLVEFKMSKSTFL